MRKLESLSTSCGERNGKDYGSQRIFKPLSGDYELISEVICEEKTKRFPLLNMFIRDEECHANMYGYLDKCGI